jgi:hypothetical protein
MMNTIPRFVLDDKRNVIDVLNPSSRKGYCPNGSSETQIDLRERMLMLRLEDLVDDLVLDLQSDRTTGLWKERPFDHERKSIYSALLCLIGATHLNALDPALAVQNRFDGKLKRQKEGLRACTSLSLFTDDVERLLRHLYGDIDQEALDPILRAVFVIVQEFTCYVRRDLWQEHNDAVVWDCFGYGRGWPEEYIISWKQKYQALEAADNLCLRARHVIEKPSTFTKYTVEFATKHIGNFFRIEESLENDNDQPS